MAELNLLIAAGGACDDQRHIAHRRIDHGRDAGLVGQLDDRAHLGAEHPLFGGVGEQVVVPADRLRELHAVGRSVTPRPYLQGDPAMAPGG